MGEEETKQCRQCAATPISHPQPMLSDVLKLKEADNAESSNTAAHHFTRQESRSTDHSYSGALDQDLAAVTDTITSIDRGCFPKLLHSAIEHLKGHDLNFPSPLDAVLARVESQKRLALIKAWEENEKTKVGNKAYKMQCAVDLWEKTKKASTQAKIKQIEENMDRKKGDYVEVMQNKIAETHRLAEEKKAVIEAQKGEEFLNVEETAAKFRTRGYVPKKFLSCFNFSF